jgi:hypothetical protein
MSDKFIFSDYLSVSVGKVRSRIQVTEFVCLFVCFFGT